MKHLSYIFILCLLLVACNKRPAGVIPPDEMEEILFDYHLTQGVIDIQPPEDFTHNQRYLDAVFANHGITEAQFDSSMIYYTREALQLKEIYQNLNRRFTEIEDALKLEAGTGDITAGLTASGDTANIWTTGTTVILRPSPLKNRYIFNIRNDSTLFLRRDRLKLLANSIFFREIAEDRNSIVELGMTIEYKNGKTTGVNRTLNSNSPIELILEVGSDDDVEALHGYFYLTSTTTTRNIAILTNIALVRMHDKTLPPPPVPTDTIPADSVKQDSVLENVSTRQHLTPEQLLQRSRTKERIKIKAVPDVRTKNSYGPTRRKSQNKTNSSK